jgi:MoxR-like ATPase
MEENLFEQRTELDELNQAVQDLKAEIGKVIVGQEAMIELLLAGILADGHILIEGVPGVAKTLTAKLLSRVISVGFSRIQFTPDLMPSDVIGTSVFNPRDNNFQFKHGPIFSNIVLIDEINRAPAKTHSALLEIMQEYRVTVDGTSHPIARPFLVLATQNPIESEGTYNLPEAQLDRFLFKLVANYPDAAEETNILRLHTLGSSPDKLLNEDLKTVTNPAEVLEVQRLCGEVMVDDRMLHYIAALVRKTRDWPTFSLGASPRAGVAILRGARAVAALEGRDYAVPDDVQEVAPWALRHRVMLTPEAEVEGQGADELLAELIKSVEVPRS